MFDFHMEVEYVFNCPVHGTEKQVFCWRAFNSECRKFWKKVEMRVTYLSWDGGELDRYLQQIQQEAP